MAGVMEGDKLKAFNAQFQRSDASPLAERTAPKATLDGANVLHKYMGGEDAQSMSGAEFYAMVGHIKRQEGAKGDALEAELMKISRQKDKKIRLIDWVSQNLGPPAAAAPVAPPPQQQMPAAPAKAATPTPVATENMPPAGTPSRMGNAPPPAMDFNVSRLDLSSAMNAERDVGGAETARGRPATARAQLGGSAMSDLLGAPASGSLTARPSTAPGGAVQDMSVCASAYVGGRDHLKMSGSEYFSLIAWLKSKGQDNVEDNLLKVRTLGDKKLHLVRHMKESCEHLLLNVSGGSPPVDVSEPTIATAPPVHVAPSATIAAPQPVAPTAPQHIAAAGGHADIASAASIQSAAIAQAVATIQQAAGGAATPAVVEGVRTLEGTLGRLEESLQFAVECMQTDLGHAKEQLAALKAHVGMA